MQKLQVCYGYVKVCSNFVGVFGVIPLRLGASFTGRNKIKFHCHCIVTKFTKNQHVWMMMNAKMSWPSKGTMAYVTTRLISNLIVTMLVVHFRKSILQHTHLIEANKNTVRERSEIDNLSIYFYRHVRFFQAMTWKKIRLHCTCIKSQWVWLCLLGGR